MAGAYVAKPATVSVPDVPPGWDADWPFPGPLESLPELPEDEPHPAGPGPLPPGYEQELSLSVSASSPTGIFNPTSAVVSTIRDHGDWPTAEPISFTLNWTATINGREVMTPLSVSYSQSGDYWGHSDDFSFNLVSGDVGEIIVLSVIGIVWGGVVLSGSANIEVEEPMPVSIVVSLVVNSHTINSPSWPEMELKVERLPSSPSRRDWPQIGAARTGDPPAIWWGDSTSFDTLAEITCTHSIPPSEARIDATGTLLNNKNYKLTFDINEGGNTTIDVTFSIVITMSDGTTRSGEINHVLTPYSNAEIEYVYIFGTTGVIYIFGTRVN